MKATSLGGDGDVISALGLGLPLLGARIRFLVGDVILTGAFCFHNIIQVDKNLVI